MKIDRLLKRKHTADCKRVRPTRAGSFANNVTGTNADDYLWDNAINDKAWKQAA